VETEILDALQRDTKLLHNVEIKAITAHLRINYISSFGYIEFHVIIRKQIVYSINTWLQNVITDNNYTVIWGRALRQSHVAHRLVLLFPWM
jgi:hypothetical protein